MINQVLAERYHIQRVLGQQVGRQTVLAEDLQTQTQVVLKILNVGEAFDWQALKLFEREAATLKTLSHPAIPQYLDYLELKDQVGAQVVLVQSYIEAQSLEQHLQRGRSFSEAEVRELAKALLEILQYLHEHQPPIVHRDIKPSNILLTDRSGNSPGQLYLVDFGSVQTLAAQAGGTMTIVGTYGYMPPEQFGGRTVPASDLYSLGATLIYLVTGLHPTELPQKQLQIEFREAAQVSSAFGEWLARLTEPDVALRPISAHQALQLLQHLEQTCYLPPCSQQPVNGEIQVMQAANSLSLLFPNQSPTFAIIGVLTLAGPVLFWLSLWLSSVLIWQPFMVNPWLFNIMMGSVIGAGTLWFVLITWIQQTHLHIESDIVTITRKIGRWEWPVLPPFQRQQITVLRFRTREPVLLSARLQLVILTDHQYRRVLDQSLNLSEAELIWLSDLLTEWLQTPVDWEIIPPMD